VFKLPAPPSGSNALKILVQLPVTPSGADIFALVGPMTEDVLCRTVAL